jgi:hypothetical protein
MFDFIKRVKDNEAVRLQAEFVQNVRQAATQFLDVAKTQALELDFSEQSLAVVDRIIAMAREGAITLDPLQRLGAAAYVYEVAREHYGGLYEVCDEDDPVVLVTGQPEFDVCLCAISKVEKLARDVSQDSLTVFFTRYTASVSARASVTIGK